MIKGAIFDVGATLIDFPAVPSPELEAGAGNVMSLANTWASLDSPACKHELMQAFVSLPKEGEQFRQINTHRETIARVMARYGLEPSEAQLEQLEDVFLLPILKGANPVNGMMSVLEALTDPFKLAIASNTRSHKLIAQGLKNFEFSSFFNPIVTSMSCGYRKPGHLIFEPILKAWSLAPEQVVMVGDKLSTDILGAGSLGIRTIWFDRWSADSSKMPNATAKNSEAILQIITQWQ